MSNEPHSRSTLVAKLGATCIHRRHEIARLRKLVAQQREQITTCWEGWSEAAQALAAAEVCLDTGRAELLEAQATLDSLRQENTRLQRHLETEDANLRQARRRVVELTRQLECRPPASPPELAAPSAGGEIPPPVPGTIQAGAAGRVLGYGGLDCSGAEWTEEG